MSSLAVNMNLTSFSGYFVQFEDTTEAPWTVYYILMLEAVTPVRRVDSSLTRGTLEWVCALENVARASRHMGSKWMKPPF